MLPGVLVGPDEVGVVVGVTVAGAQPADTRQITRRTTIIMILYLIKDINRSTFRLQRLEVLISMDFFNGDLHFVQEKLSGMSRADKSSYFQKFLIGDRLSAEVHAPLIHEKPD